LTEAGVDGGAGLGGVEELEFLDLLTVDALEGEDVGLCLAGTGESAGFLEFEFGGEEE